MIDRIAERLVLPALLVSAAVSCSPASQASEVEQDADTSFVKVVNVEVEPVARTRFTSFIRITGEVEAMNDVIVSAEEGGVVERFFVEKGAFVRAGEPLAKIDDRTLRAQVEEAAAAARLAAERHERQRRLWEDEGIGSEMTYLEAKYQAELQAARLESLKTRLDRTRIDAPISGIFDDRYVDQGEMVSPGTRVGRIVEVSRVKVIGGVPERFAGSVSSGDSARIRSDIFAEREFEGTIRYVGTAVDADSRTFPIEIVMENPNRVVKPHMVASVEIANRALTDVIVVPQSAVVRTEDGYQVYVVVDRDGALVAESRQVQLGISSQNRTVVREGLAEGERLIVRGQQMVDAGNRVRIVGPNDDE